MKDVTREFAVLVPHDVGPTLLGSIPSNIRIGVWDGSGSLPDLSDQVEVYVPPFVPSGPTADAMRELPQLAVVQALTAGTDHIEGLVPEGVALCSARGVHDVAVSEWVMAALLATVREFPALTIAQRERRVRREITDTLSGKTVMIVGYGSIGQAVERLLQPFDVDLHRVASQRRKGVYGPESLPGLLPHTDVVILLVPETARTRHLVDQRFLSLLPDGAIVINAARGGVIEQAALLEEVRAGRLRAAADATTPDPLPRDHPLWTMPGFLYTPHIAGMTSTALPMLYGLIGEQLRRYVEGQPLRNVVERPTSSSP